MSINSEQNLQIEAALEKVKSGGDFMLGYPVSQDFDYSRLNEFLKYPINNIGDPFESTTNKVQTHKMETEVVDFFAKMFRANPEDYWGYVTNGGSESNLYGLYIARELYPNAMVYFSESTHYSIKKNIRLLNIPSIVIRSQENGEIDYEDLANTLQYNRDKPAIVLTNFGTTMKEAKDDVAKVKEVLRRSAIQDHYIHCDAALSGSYGAFLEPRVPFDFEDGADSISISGHKFIGSPIPSGVIITRRSSKDRIAKGVAYIGSMDTTITGSRNGHSPLFLWYGLHQMGLEGLKARYKHSEEVAEYCKNELNKIGIDAWKNEGAITVVFPKTSKKIKEKWQLATDDVAHIICMPNVTKKQIDLFVSDVLEEQEQKAKA
jgi:histidine decarboxylase